MDDIIESIIELTKVCKEDKSALPGLASLYNRFGLSKEAGEIWLEYAQMCIEKKDDECLLSALEEFIKSGIKSLDLRFYFAKILLMKNKKEEAKEELNWLASEFLERGEEEKTREIDTYLRRL